MRSAACTALKMFTVLLYMRGREGSKLNSTVVLSGVSRLFHGCHVVQNGYGTRDHILVERYSLREITVAGQGL